MNAERTTIRRIAVGLAVAAALATSACSAGQQAGTADEVATLDGTNVNVGNIALRGLAVLTPDGVNYPVGSSLGLRLVIVNDSDTDDTLTNISTKITKSWGAFSSTASATATSTATTPIPVKRGVSVAFGTPDANGRSLSLLNSTQTVYPGSSVSITFTFAKAGTETFPVPVQISAPGGSFTPSPSYLPSGSAADAG